MRGDVGDLVLHQISLRDMGLEDDTPFLHKKMNMFENRCPNKSQRFIIIFLIGLVLIGCSITLLSMSEGALEEFASSVCSDGLREAEARPCSFLFDIKLR